MTPIPETDYQRIFSPRNVAIVGVSGKGTGFGSLLFFALREFGYAGRIFLVNPKGGELAGTRIHRRIEDIPERIDLAAIAVTADAVPRALEACRQKGAAAAEILSSGFRELGTPEGTALEEKVREIAARGIRVIGPNGFGIYCPRSKLTVIPGADLPQRSGPVAFSSQSGGMAVDFTHTGKAMGLSFSKVVSFGNGADLRETELLGHFGEDPETRVICMYIEGVADGEAFFTTLKAVAARKPVIVLKGGLSETGQRAVLSHTASMGGSARIWQAVLDQANAVAVREMPEMARTSLAFTHLPAGTYRRLAVVGGGGALGVEAADASDRHGFEMPVFTGDRLQQIERPLPRPGSSGANPIDVANPYVEPATIEQVLRLAAEDPRIELQVLITLFHHYSNLARMVGRPIGEVAPCTELADRVQAVVRDTGKPVAVILANPKRGIDHLDVVDTIETARRAFVERGIPAFDDLDQALAAIAHVNAYYERKTDG